MEKNGNGAGPKLEKEELTAEEALMLKFYRTLSEGQRKDLVKRMADGDLREGSLPDARYEKIDASLKHLRETVNGRKKDQ